MQRVNVWQFVATVTRYCLTPELAFSVTFLMHMEGYVQYKTADFYLQQ
jgi:hypothetical protein